MSVNGTVEHLNRNFASSNETHSSPIPNAQVGWFFAYIIVCGLCVAASCVLLIAVTKDQTSSLSTRILISNLCVSGIVFCLIFIPGTSIVGFFPSLWKYESARNSACPFYMGMQISFSSFSYTDAFLAFNRLIAVCFPHHYNTWQSRKMSYLMVSTAWLIGVVLVILNVLEIGGHYVPQWDFTCQAYPTSYWGMVLFFCSGFVPYLVIGIFSVIIFVTAFVKSRGLKARLSTSSSAGHQLLLLQKRLIIAKAMALLLVWTILSEIPFIVVPMYIPQIQEDHYDLWESIRLIPITPYWISPVVLLALSSSYRKSLRRCCTRANQISVRPDGAQTGQPNRTRLATGGSTVQASASRQSGPDRGTQQKRY